MNPVGVRDGHLELTAWLVSTFGSKKIQLLQANEDIASLYVYQSITENYRKGLGRLDKSPCIHTCGLYNSEHEVGQASYGFFSNLQKTHQRAKTNRALLQRFGC
jgi:hypothetical protein